MKCIVELFLTMMMMMIIIIKDARCLFAQIHDLMEASRTISFALMYLRTLAHEPKRGKLVTSQSSLCSYYITQKEGDVILLVLAPYAILCHHCRIIRKHIYNPECNSIKDLDWESNTGPA